MDKSLKKTKIFETTTFEYEKDGDVVQRDLGDLEDILIEYEITFCIDEIIVYRQQALNMIKETKNIIQIIEKQNKVPKNKDQKSLNLRRLRKRQIDLIES